jgi:hypothetical protein
MSRKDASREASTPRTGVLHLVLVVTGLLLVATAVGCGESDAEKAQTQVCDARADLKKRVDNLATLTPATATADGVKADLNAIEKDLDEIRDAQGDLNEDRKREVESATQEFASEVEAVVRDLGSDLSLSGGQATLQAAGQQLASSYRQTLARIDCD